jgi:hypothetical protein
MYIRACIREITLCVSIRVDACTLKPTLNANTMACSIATIETDPTGLDHVISLNIHAVI